MLLITVLSRGSGFDLAPPTHQSQSPGPEAMNKHVPTDLVRLNKGLGKTKVALKMSSGGGIGELSDYSLKNPCGRCCLIFNSKFQVASFCHWQTVRQWVWYGCATLIITNHSWVTDIVLGACFLGQTQKESMLCHHCPFTFFFPFVFISFISFIFLYHCLQYTLAT